MIRKSTFIVLLCAIIVGGVSYYLEFKKGSGAKPQEAPKSVLSVPEADISTLALTHPAKPEEPAIRLEKNEKDQDRRWQIVQPIAATADQTVVQSMLDNLTTVKNSDTTEAATPDRLKAYGLAPPQSEVELQAKDGVKNTLEIGNKDFSGSSVYAMVSGAKTVSLLPDSLLTVSDSTLDHLRDHTVLSLTGDQVASFTLKNPSGSLALAKTKDQWNFTKPSDAMADQASIATLLNAISSALLTSFVSEKSDDLQKYDLTNPVIDFTFVNDIGKKTSLLLGRKDGNDYFAQDTSRPGVFAVNADLYAQLAKSYGELRDKIVVHFDSADITHVEIHNDQGLIVLSSKSGDSWAIDSPSQEKGKDAAPSKIFDPLTELRADQVIDHPPANLIAKLAKPAIEVILTDKIGKTITLKMSQPSEGIVYASAGGNPALFQLKKEDFDNLNFNASSLLEQANPETNQ